MKDSSRISLADCRRIHAAEADSIAAFRRSQQAAFAAERERWRELGLATYVADDGLAGAAEEESALAPGHEGVDAPVPGNVWQVRVSVGDRVHAGQVVVVLESMKMEMEVTAPCDGIVTEIVCQQGRSVQGGQRLLVLATGGA
jgi:urea carboxylase